MEIQSNSQVYALVYAPGLRVDIQSNAHVYGAIYGRDIHIQANAAIHRDEALELECFDP